VFSIPIFNSAKYTDKGHDGQDHEIDLPKVDHIEKLLEARKRFAYGQQREYLDHANCIGWTREGDAEHAGSGCVVLLSNGDEGFKTMEVGKAHAGKRFVDWLGNYEGVVTIDDEGKGAFQVSGASVSVWVEKIN